MSQTQLVCTQSQSSSQFITDDDLLSNPLIMPLADILQLQEVLLDVWIAVKYISHYFTLDSFYNDLWFIRSRFHIVSLWLKWKKLTQLSLVGTISHASNVGRLPRVTILHTHASLAIILRQRLLGIYLILYPYNVILEFFSVFNLMDSYIV